MGNALENIQREVAEAKDAQSSAIVLIKGIRQQLIDLAANATDLAAFKAEVEGLAVELSDSTDALGAAVAEDGAGEPEPDPAPFPTDEDEQPTDPVEPTEPTDPEPGEGEGEGEGGETGEGEGEENGSGETP